MTPPSTASTAPPVLAQAALEVDDPTLADLYAALEPLSPEDRADLLDVARWNCPFGCQESHDSVNSIRRHISISNARGHANEDGAAPSKPIPGYSVDGEPVAIITAGTTPDHSTVIPGQRQRIGLRAVAPLWLTTDAALDAHPDAIPLTEYADEYTPDGPPVRWLCSACGTYTADTASEIHGHVFATQDSAHDAPADRDHLGVLMDADQAVYAFLTIGDTDAHVLPAPVLDEQPTVTLPKHWEVKASYEHVAPEDVDVDYWDCPHCDADIEGDVERIRNHINLGFPPNDDKNDDDDDVHDGHSGFYPDTLIEGYRDDEVAAMLSPASKADPNDESVVLSAAVPTVGNPVVAYINDATRALRHVQQGLAQLGVTYAVNDHDLQQITQLPYETIADARATLDSLPALAADEAADPDRIARLEVALAGSIAARLQHPFALQAFVATDATTATTTDLPDQPPEAVDWREHAPSIVSLPEEFSPNDDIYRVQPPTPDDGDADEGVPPEPVLIANDPGVYEKLAAHLDVEAVSPAVLEDLVAKVATLDALLEADRPDSDTLADRRDALAAAEQFLVTNFDVDPDQLP